MKLDCAWCGKTIAPEEKWWLAAEYKACCDPCKSKFKPKLLSKTAFERRGDD